MNPVKGSADEPLKMGKELIELSLQKLNDKLKNESESGDIINIIPHKYLTVRNAAFVEGLFDEYE